MDLAVLYCRASTDLEVQVSALAAQVDEGKRAIKQNGWHLVDTYIDEGKSGTTTKHRDEYNRMVSDMPTKKYNIVVVKSQDRLMRNTMEWYRFVQMALDNKVRIYFYMEGRFYNSDDKLITGIKAILAEEYSSDLSKKINNAHKHRQESGKSVVITSNTWGYDKIDKQVVINEKEAEIVRMIYALALNGYGSRTISKELSNRGIKSRTGNNFPEGTVRRIIRNPLFKGTAVMNKRHTDFETKRTMLLPEEEWIYHENAVPAIVDPDTWQRANDLMDQRTIKEHTAEFANKQRGKNIGKYLLSGKIVCGDCGSPYWRKYTKNSKGEEVIRWCCAEYITRGKKDGCDNIILRDDLLMDALYDVAQFVFGNEKSDIIDAAMSILQEVICNKNGECIDDIIRKKEEVMQRREQLLDRYLDGLINDEMFKRKDASLENECREYDKKVAEIKNRQKERDKKMERLEALRKDVELIASRDVAINRLIEHISAIKVYHDHLSLCLDLYQNITVNIEKINYKKMRFSIAK